LRSASNVYYAQTRSAIFVPRGSNNVPADLVAVLESPSLKFLINNFPKSMLTPELLRGGAEVAELIKPFSDEQLRAGLELVLEGVKERVEPKEETDFRREEFNVLRTPRRDEELRIRIADKAYGPDIAQYFSKITLIDKLRETRALVGFTRILPTEQELKDLKRMLRRDPAKASWLPAYVVYGEGIFLEFSEESVQTWLKENASKIAARVNPLIKRYKQVQEERKLRERIISPRFLLVHTFAHLLINRLTFECGYSSAALRERLYISDEPDAPMAGILIYTASGDAEGTMGGLVRMGKPGLLEPVIKKAVEAAQWCSADPVCMEMGRGGQGPDATNLAACHSCSLVPETSCEEFNRFLDRAMIVGELEYRSLGYFSGLLKSSSSE
jgi:hypothetical protein